MNNNFDWDDIKVFLEIANTGSLSQAAVKLEKSQPTIGRRIEKLEKSLGLNLFKRSPYGYKLTTVGDQLLSKAQNVSDQISNFVTKATLLQTDFPTTTVTITCGESFVSLLTKNMPNFRMQNPDISLNMVSCFEILNLDNGVADIAIRSQRPDNPNLITQQLGVCYYAIYASQTYLDQYPQAQQPLKASNNLSWISYKDENSELHSTKWLTTNVKSSNIKLRCNTQSSLLLSIKNHQGLAVLPQFIADNETDLIKLSASLKTLQPKIWLVLNRNARRSVETYQVVEWIRSTFEQCNFN